MISAEAFGRLRDAEASKAVDRQQGQGANPDQERRQRAEIAIEPERTSYMHDAPLYQPNRLSRPNPVKALCVAPAIDLVQSAAEKGSGWLRVAWAPDPKSPMIGVGLSCIRRVPEIESVPAESGRDAHEPEMTDVSATELPSFCSSGDGGRDARPGASAFGGRTGRRREAQPRIDS
jgi:hypothetical protein